MFVSIPQGEELLTVEIPKENIIDILQPNEKPEIVDLNEHIMQALQKPVSSLPLINMLKPDMKIVIIIDDNTRPTPTKNIITPVLDIIKEQGIPNRNITIIFALGLHRKLTKDEQVNILGKTIFDNYLVENHDAYDNNNLIDLGITTFGTPILLNKKVYEADLRILTGLIKPHNQAGYSGGGKSILPGVCGAITIQSNHNYKSMSNPYSCLGVIAKNPIREDIEESTALIGSTFIINVIMDYNDRIIGVVAGNLIEAHRTGARHLDYLVKQKVDNQCDICICGTPSPIDINFYQMLNSLSAPYRLPRPIVRDGGTIIVVGRAEEGISDGDFYKQLVNSTKEELWEKIQEENHNIKDRAALQIFLQGALKYNLVVVSQKSNENTFKEMRIEHYSDLQMAVNEVIKRYELSKNTIIMPYAPYLIASF